MSDKVSIEEIMSVKFPVMHDRRLLVVEDSVDLSFADREMVLNQDPSDGLVISETESPFISFKDMLSLFGGKGNLSPIIA